MSPRGPRCLVTVVSGPPASGKTTWARSQRQRGDLLLDWDELLAALTGLELYERPPELTYFANAATQAVIKALRRSIYRFDLNPRAAWVIRGAPSPKDRELFTEPVPYGLGARIVVLPVPAEVCHERIDADERRAPTREAQHEAVDAWWDAYAPAECDVLLSETMHPSAPSPRGGSLNL